MLKKKDWAKVSFHWAAGSRNLALCVSALLCILSPLKSEGVSNWEWENVPRIVAADDVHGDIAMLRRVLIGSGIVDAQLSWKAGEDHLVMCGDLVERGPADKAVLDPLLRVQKDAESKGGYVHVLLGDHDVLNLVRDLRYVSRASYAGFVSEGSPSDRAIGWAEFKKAFSEPGLDEMDPQEAFQKEYPPGYFGRVKAFAANGTYGAWLRKQPVIVKINRLLFLHAGLPPEVAALGLEDQPGYAEQPPGIYGGESNSRSLGAGPGGLCSLKLTFDAKNVSSNFLRAG